MTRVYLDARLDSGLRLPLPEAAFRHLIQVLRMESGDTLRVFDGRGKEFEARLDSISRREAWLLLADAITPTAESALHLTLAQSLSKGERMDYSLQKAVELGVAAIQPLLTARSVVRLDAERSDRKLDHWQGVIVSACEQCGRATLPTLQPTIRHADWLAQGGLSGALRLTLDPQAELGLRDLQPEKQIVLMVGPEGGLSADELAQARAAGFTGIRLGPRVLRTETAGVAALAAIQALWGDLA
ncbi:MAG: 16S rRNA (uracil(1498)-N(3))-methyltransferase [Panacagrimonas sp.]